MDFLVEVAMDTIKEQIEAEFVAIHPDEPYLCPHWGRGAGVNNTWWRALVDKYLYYFVIKT